jgi:hypothetical protein
MRILQGVSGVVWGSCFALACLIGFEVARVQDRVKAMGEQTTDLARSARELRQSVDDLDQAVRDLDAGQDGRP